MQGINVVGLQFNKAGKIYDFSYSNIKLNIGDRVLVETDRGLGVGRVVVIGFHDSSQELKHPLKPIVRKLEREELKKNYPLSAEEVTVIVKDKVTEHKLKMKILKSNILYGGNRITIYFSAPGRVDFRSLVKDLAGNLKARVELKQVGARDETKLLGGVGICGREYCCSSFLREFVPVSIKMAKNQNLALNPTKVSGGCGRLLCCLTYENDTYTALRKVMPPIGSLVQSHAEPPVKGKVLKADLLNQLVLVALEDGQSLELPVASLEILPRR